MLCALSVCGTSNAQSKSQVLVVRYCDLVANPDGYDGKQIRLRAEYDSGSEHSVFADDHCVKSWDAQKLVWVEFDSALASNTKAPTMARFEALTIAKFEPGIYEVVETYSLHHRRRRTNRWTRAAGACFVT